MGAALATWEARVRALLGGVSTAQLPNADIDQHVFAAVRQFSLDRPRIVFADYTGDGATFQLGIPTGWVNDFSWVEAIEYPQGQRPPVFLDPAEIELYPVASAPTAIQLNWTTPAVGTTSRLSYAVPYPLPDTNAATDLIPAVAFEFVAKLAAAGGATQLAGRASPNTRPNFPSADIAGVEGEEKRWLDIADDYRKEYQGYVGTSGGRAPASAVIDWDASSDWVYTAGRWLFRWPRR